MVTAQKLNPKDRKRVNEQLYDLCRVRHPHIPLADIAGFLKPLGITFEEAILCGRDGRATFDLFKDEQEIGNSILVLTWYKGEAATYEIVAYLS